MPASAGGGRRLLTRLAAFAMRAEGCCFDIKAAVDIVCRDRTRADAMWPDRRLIELLRIELPIVQAPMAGAMDFELAAAAAEAGALGSLPCAMLNAAQVREQIGEVRARTKKPINLNFFCHTPPTLNNAREARWRERLAPYYRELAIDPAAPIPTSNRTAFDARDVRRGGRDRSPRS